MEGRVEMKVIVRPPTSRVARLRCSPTPWRRWCSAPSGSSGQHREQGGMAEGAGGPRHLERNNYETYQETAIPASTETGRQELARPGQFLFRNNYNVYLHDTPQGELFRRTFGRSAMDCIRLESRRSSAVWVARVAGGSSGGRPSNGPDNNRQAAKQDSGYSRLSTILCDGELISATTSTGATTRSCRFWQEDDAIRRRRARHAAAIDAADRRK